MKNHHIWGRFLFALAGLKDTWKSERSFRSHVVAFACVVVLLLVMRPAAVWWAVLLLASCGMMAVELINTAVEKLANHLNPGRHEAIRIVKDALAAAVFMMCAAGVCVLAAFLWMELTL
jgi:diacylglycerol kinase (ATP)